MQIVIPMAGRGERFERAGYKTIKPLIEVDGKPMIEYVVNFFPGEEKFVFICNEEHLAKTALENVLRKLKPQSEIVTIHYEKNGPVFGILEAATHIADADPTIVNYCDFDIHWDYTDFKRTMKERDADSAALCYQGFHPHLLGPNVYAGVRTAEDGRALEVREKHSFTEDKTQSWHQAGMFYFRSGAMLKKYAKLVYDEGVRTNGECYLSNLFNHMITDGLNSIIYPVQYFCQWGTPEDLAEYHRGIAAARQRPAAAGKTATLAKTNEEKTVEYWREFLDQRTTLA